MAVVKVGQRRIHKVGFHAALIAVSIVMLFPLAWMVISSLKSELEVVAIPPVLFPADPNFGIYKDVLLNEQTPFLRMFFNSMIVTVGITTLQLATGAMAAYALSRLDFPGRRVIFGAVLATMMIPVEAIIVPLFLVTKELGMINTFPGLILPFSVRAFSIFLLRQAFSQVPRDLEEAAEVDGLGIPGVFWHMILPLSRPAIMAMVALVSVQAWNLFLWPLVASQSNDMRTILVGIATFLGNSHTGYTWTNVLAASTIAIIPVLVVFIFAQRYFTEGISITGTKG